MSNHNPKTLKESLAGKIPPKLIGLVPRAFDMVGSIGIVEIPTGLEKYEKIIAKTLLEITPNIKTIAKKAGGHTGIYRRQKIRILAGKRTKTTIHSENQVRLKVHVEDSYFSPRVANERQRIASLVKPDESVLVMFSGLAPYPLVIAKNSQAKIVVGIEINPKSHDLAKESLELNKKLKDRVRLYVGDVREVVPALTPNILSDEGNVSVPKRPNTRSDRLLRRLLFDRVVMPAPKNAESFLDIALSASKKGTIIHCYTFCKEEEIPSIGKKVIAACNLQGRKCKELSIIRCGQIGIREYRVCVDFEVLD